MGSSESVTEKKETTEDMRGIRRGRCMSENCDCDSYFFSENNDALCRYCKCPPTKHQRLGSPLGTENTTYKQLVGTKTNTSLLTTNYYQYASNKTPRDILQEFECLISAGKVVLKKESQENENNSDFLRLKTLIEKAEKFMQFNILDS